ncbi:LysR family transcriptional regulator [Xanthomonas citri]|uniref:LysR family transcriptional regulator n=1 Tax=Xanthomonas citri TaxID=346 RepID=UPI0018859A4A|nr:LysR family transcriptional regulator [Xanthomonas citri]QOY21993.1 LysR family transcriptional regulator [Xanthomonas citri]QQK68135.1 LysR family transcriptional regulator [Xanthomonas citri]
MAREDFGDLIAFVAVAQELSFTKAAAKLGLSQSALSQSVRGLEAHLGVRLLTRTTRSVSLTAAGQRLYESTAPRFFEIKAELAAILELRDTPSGSLRITASEHAADTVLWPRLANFLIDHPDIKVEVAIDYGLADIAADRYDMGIRLGEEVANGMIAVRVGPDQRFAVVGSPEYFTRYPKPTKPQDLELHNCICFRLATHGGLYAWEFKKGKKEIRVRVEGQTILNGMYQVLTASLQGVGLAFLPEDIVRPHVRGNGLIEVMTDWCPTFPGFHLYYPSRRQTSKAMSLLVDALRYRV